MTFLNITATQANLVSTASTSKKQQRGHVLPHPPQIDLSQPGRLRTAHVLSLCAISHSSLYNRMKAGTFPRPDGIDGNRNYWRTDTIRAFLED